MACLLGKLAKWPLLGVAREAAGDRPKPPAKAPDWRATGAHLRADAEGRDGRALAAKRRR
jgi:hypothetical protein